MLFHMKHRAPPVLKLIVLSIVVAAGAACSRAAPHPSEPQSESHTDVVQQAAVAAPCPEIISLDVSGLVVTATVASNGTIPFGQVPKWRPSDGRTTVGQCWVLRAVNGTFGGQQKICSQQDPTSCIRLLSGQLVIASFSVATPFNIGHNHGRWMTVDGASQILPPPANNANGAPLLAGTPLAGQQTVLWLTNTTFFANSVNDEYWTTDGSTLNVSDAPPSGSGYVDGIAQPGIAQQFTSTYVGLGETGPILRFTSVLAGAQGKTLSFIAGHGSDVLGHVVPGSQKDLYSSYILHPSIYYGPVFFDQLSDCVYEVQSGGFGLTDNPCNDPQAFPMVFEPGWIAQ